MEERIHNGGRFCRAVRYAVAGETEGSSGHRVSCRRASGAPSVAHFSPLGSGEPAEHPSSEGVIRAHRGDRGTSLTYRREAGAGRVDVTTASLNLPDRFAPTHHTWPGEGVGWENVEDGCCVSREAGRRTRGPRRRHETNRR